MKKCSLLLIVLTVFAVLFLPNQVQAKEKVKVYLFRSSTCSVCKSAVAFFEELSSDSEYGSMFEIVDFEVSTTKNSELMQKAADIMGDGNVTGVPYIVIGDRSFGGYTSSWDDDIKAEIKETYEDEDFADPLVDLLNETTDNKEAWITIGVLAVAALIVVGTIMLARDHEEPAQEDETVKEENVEVVEKEISMKENHVPKKTTSAKTKKTSKQTTTKKKRK